MVEDKYNLSSVSMLTKKSQLKGKRIMPKLVSGIIRLPLGWDLSGSSIIRLPLRFLGLHRRPMFDYFSYLRHLKLLNIIRYFFFFDILRRSTTFYERHSVVLMVAHK